MKLRLSALLAALITGTAAIEYRAMTTRPAVLQKRDPVCVEDSCFQAVQATDFCTCIRQGSVDCASYFITTITPDLETVYTTTYTAYTSSSTESATVTTIIDETASETEDITVSTTTTTTSTEAVTSTQQGKGKVKRRGVAARKNEKRRPDRRMPYYASQACAGRSEYESACACMGVYSTVIYAPGSTTTLTSVESTYSPTLTETTTVSTESTTTTVATQTVTATVSTETVSATATPAAQGPFWIQVSSVSGGTFDVTGNYATIEFMTDRVLQPYSLMNFNTAQASDGAVFYIDSDGYLRNVFSYDNAYYWTYPDNGDADNELELLDKQQALDAGFTLLRCTITPTTNVLVCGGVPDGSDNFRICGAYPAYIAPSTRANTGGCDTIEVVAVPYVVPPSP